MVVNTETCQHACRLYAAIYLGPAHWHSMYMPYPAYQSAHLCVDEENSVGLDQVHEAQIAP